MIRGIVKSLLSIALFCSCNDEFIYSQELMDPDPILRMDVQYIAVLGDIQEYTGSVVFYPYLEHTMNWLWSQKQHGLPINCVLHVGDVTWNNSSAQWSNFYKCTAPCAEDLLYVTCTGNHDYTWDDESLINDRSSTRINEYAAFPLTRSRIVAAFEPNKIENIVVEHTIHGMPFDLLILEFGPRTEVLAWANDYVASHPDRKFILMTHEFLTSKGSRIHSDSYAERQFRNTTASSPEQVWRQLVKENDNILCVLCGHNGFSARLFTKNSAGRPVPQILFNLQYQENGGDGWIQLWEFPFYGDSVSVSVYNTIRREFHPDPATSFKFRYRY